MANATGHELVITQRELIEWIQLSKHNSEDIASLMKVLRGNGTPGLVHDVEYLKFQVKVLIGAMLLFVTPLAGILISLIIGLLINKVEVIVH